MSAATLEFCARNCLDRKIVGADLVPNFNLAVASGIAANSLTLVAFGIDSVIELASAGLLIWRLTVELRRGQMFAESAEQKASRIGGSLLFVLAAYVVKSRSIATPSKVETSH